jgi:hypothetical protein
MKQFLSPENLPAIEEQGDYSERISLLSFKGSLPVFSTDKECLCTTFFFPIQKP